MSHTVLFVDDEANVLSALRHALHKENYDILTAASAQEALDTLKIESVDVIVSDDQMPGMLGSEMLAIVQKEYPLIVRILLTGQASIESAARAINEGRIYRFLIKPCYEELAVTVRQALQQRELMVESNHLLAVVQRQAEVLEEIQGECPEITGFGHKDDWALADEEMTDDVDALIKKIDDEVQRSENYFSERACEDAS